MPGAALRKTIEGMVCRFIGFIDSLQEPSYITCVFMRIHTKVYPPVPHGFYFLLVMRYLSYFQLAKPFL